jgi:curved DNA-binding protein CbpA
MHDLYEVLQVRRGADAEVIRAAYRALARANHPDFGGSPDRMARINDAWAVLGNPERRAAYDADLGTAGPVGAAATTGQPTPPPAPTHNGHGLAGRRPQPEQSGTVIDFGRYSGWTVGALVDVDPDYLEWLARTPIGRRLTAEIQAALARRAAQAAELRPVTKPIQQRRSFIRPWSTAASGAR